MDSKLESKMISKIKSTTTAAAIEEWKKSQVESEEPLYNYRYDHVELVVRLSQYLAKQTDADLDVITLAGWLHDIAKPGVGGVKNHGELSAGVAECFLKQERVDPKIIERACDAIRKHVGLTLNEPLDPVEAQVLWDADKIVKLGVVGFIHFLLNGIRINPGMNIHEFSSRVHEYIPLAQKIVQSMNTAEGKKIAEERLDVLKEVSRLLDKELKIGL
jgi:HD superfamily phosphodiesterase